MKSSHQLKLSVNFSNGMTTTKFQAICIGKNAHENIASFKVDSVEIKCEENVTLLGVNIDFMLSFDDHVTDICKKLQNNWQF